MKNNFRWIDLDRKKLIDIFKDLENVITNKKLKVSKIHSYIKNHIKSHLPIKVSKKINPEIKKNCIYIGGMYCFDRDQKSQKSIELLLFYRDKNESILLKKSYFKKMGELFADTILHEIVHMSQYRKRDFHPILDYRTQNSSEDQSYLGCNDEIDAYAFNISCDIVKKYKDIDKIREKLLSSNFKIKKSDSYDMYLKAFDNDTEHKIIKKLQKRILYYLPYAIIGKPFKKNQWLIY